MSGHIFTRVATKLSFTSLIFTETSSSSVFRLKLNYSAGLLLLVGETDDCRDLDSRLQNYIIEHSSDRLSLRWAEAMESGRRHGRPISAADAWIAATALHIDVPLITHNKNHFIGVEGLTILSESPS